MSTRPCPSTHVNATRRPPPDITSADTSEHSAEGMLLETVSGVKTIDEVLPDAFGPRQLAEFKGAGA